MTGRSLDIHRANLAEVIKDIFMGDIAERAAPSSRPQTASQVGDSTLVIEDLWGSGDIKVDLGL